MTEDERSKALIKIASHYGLERQRIKIIEELSELTTEIAKTNTLMMIDEPVEAESRREYVICEMADVKNMIEQMMFLMNCADEVKGVQDYKIKRQLRRIETERGGME